MHCERALDVDVLARQVVCITRGTAYRRRPCCMRTTSRCDKFKTYAGAIRTRPTAMSTALLGRKGRKEGHRVGIVGWSILANGRTFWPPPARN